MPNRIAVTAAVSLALAIGSGTVALALRPVATRRLAAAGRERFRVILRYRQPDATV